MARMVSTDTIQLLLKQRQELRESLMELRRDIASLDASSRAMVERSIPKPASGPEASGATAAPAAASASSPSTTATPPPFPATQTAPAGTPMPENAAAPFPPRPETSKSEAANAGLVIEAMPKVPSTAEPPKETGEEKQETAPPGDAAAASVVAAAVETAPKDKAAAAAGGDAAPAEAAKENPAEATSPESEGDPEIEQEIPAAAPTSVTAPEADPHIGTAAAAGPEAEAKQKEAPALGMPSAAPVVPATSNETSDTARRTLLGKASLLAAYLAEHPSPVPPAELDALDAAIAISEKATTASERAACHQTLQATYRKVAGASFAASGVTGTTLEDSAAGAPVLWSIPFALSILILILFPALLLLRTLSAQMFTEEFATDVIWSIGAIAGFLWGAVGALTQIALNTALAVRRRRFDGGIRQSPFLRAALGGVTGALVFLALEVWLPMQSAAAEFMLDMAAFAGGLFSTLLFAALQSLISLLTGLMEPRDPKPAAAQRAKK